MRVVIYFCINSLTTALQMEVGCRGTRAAYPWLAIPMAAMRSHKLGVQAPVTLNDSGEWLDANEHTVKPRYFELGFKVPAKSLSSDAKLYFELFFMSRGTSK